MAAAPGAAAPDDPSTRTPRPTENLYMRTPNGELLQMCYMRPTAKEVCPPLPFLVDRCSDVTCFEAPILTPREVLGELWNPHASHEVQFPSAEDLAAAGISPEEAAAAGMHAGAAAHAAAGPAPPEGVAPAGGAAAASEASQVDALLRQLAQCLRKQEDRDPSLPNALETFTCSQWEAAFFPPKRGGASFPPETGEAAASAVATDGATEPTPPLRGLGAGALLRLLTVVKSPRLAPVLLTSVFPEVLITQ